MSTPFLGEIKIISWNYPPKGWAFCNGQVQAINQNAALFALFGTFYGGNGTTTFALPNLQGRVPFHMGSGFVIGQVGGEAAHTLNINEIPTHNHVPVGTSATASAGSLTNNLWCINGVNNYNATPDSVMSPASIGPTGGSQQHENMSPYLVLNFIVSLTGIFPSRN